MINIDYMKLFDRLFVLKPQERKIIREKIEELRKAKEDDEAKS